MKTTEHITVGRRFNRGKVAPVHCTDSDDLDGINIRNKCFLLIILTGGRLEMRAGDETVRAAAPAFVCFDETENPLLISKQKARYTCIYFHPRFLNVNMTFELLRSRNYGDLATNHDLFMLKPFVDRVHVVPILEPSVGLIERAAAYLRQELEEQRDWYWSCRSRSYFMEIIIALERMYGMIGYGLTHQEPDRLPIIRNPRIRDAVLFIESHYPERLTLTWIAAEAGINQASLTAMMKEELGCTAMDYLTRFRIAVSKKHLAFTEIPIKDVADTVGFRTVQHFNRVFKQQTGSTPAGFRKAAVENRKEEFNGRKQN